MKIVIQVSVSPFSIIALSNLATYLFTSLPDGVLSCPLVMLILGL